MFQNIRTRWRSTALATTLLAALAAAAPAGAATGIVTLTGTTSTGSAPVSTHNITTTGASTTLAVAATPLCPAPSTTGALRTGVNDGRGWWIGSPNLPVGYPVQAHRTLANFDMKNLRNTHLKLRADFILSDIDPNGDGVPDSWTFPDALFKTAAQWQVKVLPLLRSGALPDTAAKRLAFANITAAIVSRYKAGGTFWTANPTLSAVPIDTAEIWNEENLTSYWAGTQTDYGRLVGQVGYRTQLTTPGFRFVSGGMAETSSNGQTPSAWLSGALAHQNDEIPAQANYWFALKGVGLHTYGWPNWSVANAQTNYAALAQWITAIGGDRPPIWVTEMGWRHSNTPSAAANTYSETEIASRYQALIGWIRSTYGNCGEVYGYNLRMANSGNGLDDGFGYFKTVGTLDGADTTQRDSGARPGGAFDVLSQFAGFPFVWPIPAT